MKLIPIKTQRIIALIPGFNLLCLPIFIYNSFIARINLKDYLRSWLFYLFPAVFLGILRELVVPLFPTTGVVVGHMFNYIIALCVGYRLASFQERHY